jgi:hypothetical protein
MANLFDPANSPTQEPLEVVVGDFIQWRRTDLGADYPNDLFTATYVARITGGGASEIQITGTAYGLDYLFSVSSAASADFSPGFYHFQLEMLRDSDSERLVVDRGSFTVIVDLDTNNTDPRSHAEIMIGKIEARLESRADVDVSNYSINGRSPGEDVDRGAVALAGLLSGRVHNGKTKRAGAPGQDHWLID